MDASQMATGAQMPQGTVAPDQAQVGGDITKVMQVLGMAIEQAVDGQGFVDMNRLIAMWPQIAQQGGVNIPFQTVMQLIQQNPNLISDLIIKHGLAGIIMSGRHISAEQLAGMGSGAVGSGG